MNLRLSIAVSSRIRFECHCGCIVCKDNVLFLAGLVICSDNTSCSARAIAYVTAQTILINIRSLALPLLLRQALGTMYHITWNLSATLQFLTSNSILVKDLF